LDRVGCFAYSPVEGAAANVLPDPIPDPVKEERRARFMAAQEKISATRLQAKIGRSMTVLVDEVGKKGAAARSAADAPEIDGLVYVEDGKRLKPGAFARVRITRADSHDLWAMTA
jgi:ribosomal protein S12 methylthiotransferase